jgi:hypothetical protein
MAAPRSASAKASAAQVVVADLGRILADFGGKFSLRTLPTGSSIRPHIEHSALRIEVEH